MKIGGVRVAAGCMIALLVVATMSWVLLGRGIALALEKTSPELALRFDDANPEALVRVNEAETEIVAKARRARLVLSQRPMDGRAFRQLAEAEQIAGRPRMAAALFRVALQNTPRDRLAQAWMADDAVARGATPEAMTRLMLLADMDATLWQGLFPYMRQLSTRDSARSLLIERMAKEPAWRSQFLSAWEHDVPASFDAVMLVLEGEKANLTTSERELWVQHLIGLKRWSSGFLAWTGGLPIDKRPPAVGVTNGGFEWAPTGPFDWKMEAGGGNRMDLLGTAGVHGERALRVQFNEQLVNRIAQKLVLPPGDHELRARARQDGQFNGGGLEWSVRCMRDQKLLGAGPALRHGSGWNSYGFRFEVPQNCSAQQLSLEVTSGSEIVGRNQGVAWIDDVSLTAPIRAARTHAVPTGAAGRQTGQVAGVPAAMLIQGADQTTIERAGRTLPAEAGALLMDGDRIASVPPATTIIRWRDDCQSVVAAALPITLQSPCVLPAPAPASPVHPQAMQIVRASLAAHPWATGSTGGDVPVGP